MSKTTNRVLSMVLTVFMVISMLTVFAVAEATPFAETYDGTVISKKALLVDATITETDEVITRTWDGKEYTFVVGVNAFKTNAEVYEYIKDQLEAGEDDYFKCPDIIVLALDNTNFLIDTASKVYSPAWNIAPMNEMGDMTKVGAQGNGVDWTENTAFAEKSINIIPIFDGDVNGTMAIYGFTFHNKVFTKGVSGWGGGVRSNPELVADIQIVNSVMATDQQIPWDAYYGNAEEQDSLTIKNIYFKTVPARLFCDGAFPLNVTIDGMYINFDTINNTNNKNVYFKTYSTKHASFVIKNSNMRGTMGPYGSSAYSYFVVAGYAYNGTEDKAVTIQNNTLAYKDGNGMGMVNYTDGGTNSTKPAMTSTAKGGITSYVVKDNYFDASLGGLPSLIYHNFPVAETIEYTGNKVVGFTGAVQFDSANENIVANNNFVTSATSGFDTVVGDEVVIGESFADYAMTIKTSEIVLNGVLAGTSDAAIGSIDPATKSLNVTLGASKTTAGMTFSIGDKATAKLLDSNKEEVAAATAAGVYYIRVTSTANAAIFRDYTVNVYETAAEPFATTYDGTVIPKTALLVDASITEEADEVVERVWDGVLYKFTVGTNAFKTMAEAYAYAEDAEIERPAIIVRGLASGAELKLDMASDVYGPNWNTAPMLEMTDSFNAIASEGADWTPSEVYAENELKVGDFVVAGDVEGSVSIHGFTLAGYIKHDNLRNAESEKLETLIKNCKVQTNPSNSNIIKGTGNTSEANEDVVTFKNLWLDTINGTSTGASRFFGDNTRHTPHMVFDGLYVDMSVAKFLKANDHLKVYVDNTSLTFKNSNLRKSVNNASPYWNIAQYTAAASGSEYTKAVTFENNVMYNWNNSGIVIYNSAGVNYYGGSNVITIKDNFVANTFGTPLKLLNGSEYAYKNGDVTEVDIDLTVTGNVLLGVTTQGYLNDDVTNNFWVSESKASVEEYKALKGAQYAGVGEYYVNYAKTVLGSDLVLVDAQAGTSDATVSTIDQDAKSLVITLGSNKTTAGMALTVGEKATVKLLDADKNEVAAATEAGTYYIRVTSTADTTVYQDYTVSVLGAPAEPFATTYNVDEEGEILNTALLVDTGITDAAGSVIEREWDDKFYKFTVGTNAFDSLDAAYAYITENEIEDPQIIVTNYTGSIYVKQIANIYGKNWNTVPMNEMGDMTKVGAKSNGEDWTANPKYTENEIKIENLIFEGGFVCDEDQFVKVAGFTVTGYISTDAEGGKVKRTPGERINAELVNFRADSTKYVFDHHYTASSGTAGAAYLAENDALIVRNMKYDMCGGRFWNGDGAVPSYLEIDGLYVDFSKLTGMPDTVDAKANTFMKKAGAHATTIVKNSNIRGTVRGHGNSGTIAFAAWSGASYNYDEDYGYSYNVEFDNNTLTFKSVDGAKDADGNYTGNYRQLYFEGGRFTGLSITNNYMDRGGCTAERIYSSNPANVGGQLPALIPGYEDTVTVFVGNKVVGYPLTEKFAKDDKVEAYDNYFASEVRADGNYVGVPGDHPAIHTGGFTDSWCYYLDYDMTVKSNVIYNTYSIIDAGKNMIVSKEAAEDEEGEILYSYDDKVVNNEGTITVNLAHIIDGVHANNKATIYVDGQEADVKTGTLTLTADADNCASLKLSVWSHDKTKAITWNVLLSEPTHNWGEWTADAEATCQAPATEKRVCLGNCMVADGACTAFQTREVGDVVAHKYENYTASSTATCEKAGTLTGKCKWCDATDVIDNPDDPKKAHAGEKVEGQKATCTADGWKDYYACANGCNKLFADENYTVVIEDLDAWKKADGKIAGGHKIEKVDGQKATCTVDGWKDYHKCSVCGAFFADAEGKTAIADLEAWKKADGKVAAGHVWGEWVYNNDATEEADGTETRTCTVCQTEKETRTKEGSKLPPSVVIQDTSKVFTDVKAGKWYTKAVDYCYSYGFIAGTSATEFGRDTNVTRGMFITILARIAGVDTGKAANKAATTKFTDVKAGKYYAAAIKWANDNGIVKGTSATTFGPEDAISRQDLCVMIVNYANFMKVTLAEKEAEIAFSDATKISKYARNAVKACQMADIVNGYAAGAGFEFRPKNTATRAEAAQILYVFHSNFMAK